MDSRIVLKTDSSAVKGIASRRGVRKTRQIEVSHLWVQEKFNNGGITLIKVVGSGNFADALTKYVVADKLKKHMESTNQSLQNGGHALMPHCDV